MEERILVPVDKLKNFCMETFLALGVPKRDAKIAADVIVEADLMGIDSHGVARLKRYVSGIKDGMINPKPKIKVVKESSVTALIDGDAGLGQVVAYKAMKLAIEKAKNNFLAFVAVRNSNHYGIASYYSMMALKEGMIGISMTNSDTLVVPTFGKDAILGTNPISIAVPAKKEKPFIMDFATSVVSRGKLEKYSREGKKIPLGWALNVEGLPTSDPVEVLENLKKRKGGGILPLGGFGEEFGGHKGYGLALAVDIFSGVLSGSGYADLVYKRKSDGRISSNIGHFFGAIRIDAFRDVEEFKEAMDDLIRRIKNSGKAKGYSRIYIHGEKELETREKRLKEGVPLHPKVIEAMREVASDLGIDFLF
ncbi:MAG TPA: Ldh family oxidoreductase [Candidatus Altiarchaeales archaeon]|nr:Ldh family oxidoreductase [Candidatus Altiarchaeales archaeon]